MSTGFEIIHVETVKNNSEELVKERIPPDRLQEIFNAFNDDRREPWGSSDRHDNYILSKIASALRELCSRFQDRIDIDDQIYKWHTTTDVAAGALEAAAPEEPLRLIAKNAPEGIRQWLEKANETFAKDGKVTSETVKALRTEVPEGGVEWLEKIYNALHGYQYILMKRDNPENHVPYSEIAPLSEALKNCGALPEEGFSEILYATDRISGKGKAAASGDIKNFLQTAKWLHDVSNVKRDIRKETPKEILDHIIAAVPKDLREYLAGLPEGEALGLLREFAPGKYTVRYADVPIPGYSGDFRLCASENNRNAVNRRCVSITEKTISAWQIESMGKPLAVQTPFELEHAQLTQAVLPGLAEFLRGKRYKVHNVSRSLDFKVTMATFDPSADRVGAVNEEGTLVNEYGEPLEPHEIPETPPVEASRRSITPTNPTTILYIEAPEREREALGVPNDAFLSQLIKDTESYLTENKKTVTALTKQYYSSERQALR